VFRKKKVEMAEIKIYNPIYSYDPIDEAYYIFSTKKRSEILFSNYPCAVAHCLSILETEGCQGKTDFLEKLIKEYGPIKILESRYYDIMPSFVVTDVKGNEEAIK